MVTHADPCLGQKCSRREGPRAPNSCAVAVWCGRGCWRVLVVVFLLQSPNGPLHSAPNPTKLCSVSSSLPNSASLAAHGPRVLERGTAGGKRRQRRDDADNLQMTKTLLPDRSLAPSVRSWLRQQESKSKSQAEPSGDKRVGPQSPWSRPGMGRGGGPQQMPSPPLASLGQPGAPIWKCQALGRFQP